MQIPAVGLRVGCESFEALPHGRFDAQLFDRLIGRKRNVGGGVLADLPGLATAWVGR